MEGAAGDEGTDRSPDTVAGGTSAYSQYIAFGDSFTSGFGLVDVATKCIQSPRAWPPQVNTLLGIASPLVFAACSGANTQDIVAYGPLVKAKKQAGPQIALLPPPEEQRRTIVAVGYPHLVNATSACAGVWSAVPEDYRQRLNDVADAINAKIARAAENAGIFSITDDVVAAFAGREACSPRELISRVTMHPNAAGHQAIARVVANGVSAAP